MALEKEIKKWSVFWRLTTTWKVERRKIGRGTYPYYECICSCWTKKFIHYFSLQKWTTKSCWCLQKDSVGNLRKTHGLSMTRIYKIRAGMKKRCYNPKSKSFKNYGARWIVICDERLNNFEKFYEDMGESYEEHIELYWIDNTTLDRIDNNKSYCKDNCRWATKKEQANNKRKGKWKREKKYWKSERELAEECGASYGSFRYQLHKFNGDMEALLKKYQWDKLELD